MSRCLSRWRRALAAAPLLLVLAGCGADPGAEAADSAEAAAETRVFTADNGDVEIPADPQRVVATGYAVPVLIEAEASLVGISTWERGTAMMSPDDLATYQELPKVAGERAADTNYEAIAQARPDLIVIGVPAPAMVDVDLDRLEALAPVVVIGPTSPDGWRELSERQMDAAGRSAEFAAAQATYQAAAAELREKYAAALDGLEFGHLGGYGDMAAGTFHREVAGSWGTNIAGDVGVDYTGRVAEAETGSGEVSEYPSMEQLPAIYGDYDALTYTVEPDGSISPEVQHVLDSSLWKNLPAVRAGNVFGLRYTEAATYQSALQTLDAIDQALAPLLDR